MKINQKLHAFASKHKFLGNKGPLCVGLVITRLAREKKLPLDSEKMLTKGGGQVKGLGKGAVQKILKDYGISRILASEGGRTSRGSIGNMQDYVGFINLVGANDAVDLEEVEKWWIDRIHDYFSASPLKLKVDRGISLRNCLCSVFEEAATRQAQSPGATIVGAVMQHLVGAKLEILYPGHEFQHHGYSVADSSTNRSGDFLIGDSVIHVTTAPSEMLLTKCEENLAQNLVPLIVSSAEGAAFAQKLASEIGLQKRIDVLDIEQFLVTNIIEWTRFNGSERKSILEELVKSYNEIIETCETDPGLRIELS